MRYFLKIFTWYQDQYQMRLNRQSPRTMQQPLCSRSWPRLTLPAELVERISEFIPVQAVFALRLPSRTLGHRLALDQRFCYKCLISGDSIPHSWVVEPGTGKQIKECLPNHIAHRSQRDCKYLTRSLSDAGDIVGKGNEKRGVPLGL